MAYHERLYQYTRPYTRVTSEHFPQSEHDILGHTSINIAEASRGLIA